MLVESVALVALVAIAVAVVMYMVEVRKRQAYRWWMSGGGAHMVIHSGGATREMVMVEAGGQGVAGREGYLLI